MTKRSTQFFWLTTKSSLWDDIIKRCHFWHPFYLSGFTKAEELFFHAEGRLFIYQSAAGFVLYPALLQPYRTRNATYFDLRSNLYAGPISNARDEEGHRQLVSGLIRAIEAAARANGWVTDYCRNNPFRPMDLEGRYANTLRDAHVAIDCSSDYAEVYRFYYPSVRRCIRRAEQAGLERRPLTTIDQIDSLADLYDESMRRLNAPQRYRFDRGYFLFLGHFFADYVDIDGIYLGDQIIGGGVRLVGNGYAFAYLACTDPLARHLRPSHFYHHRAIRKYCERGFKYFVLGGGVPGRPGVLDFKRYFFLYYH